MLVCPQSHINQLKLDCHYDQNKNGLLHLYQDNNMIVKNVNFFKERFLESGFFIISTKIAKSIFKIIDVHFLFNDHD